MAYLLFAAVASAVGIAAVLLRNRRPTTMQSSIGEFERGLRALAPAPGEVTGPVAGPRSGDGDGREAAHDLDHDGEHEVEPDAAEAGGRDAGAGRSG